MTLRALALAVLLAACGPASAADPLTAAIADAKAAKRPLLAVIGAGAECRGCRYLEARVLTGERWAAVEKRAIVQRLALDAALAEGHQIHRTPTVLVIGPDGAERGRIVGERTAEAFFGTVEALLARSSGLDRQRWLAQETTREGAAATAALLENFHARDLGDAGFAWWLRLPLAVRGQHGGTPEVLHWRNRVEFLRSAQRRDLPAGVIAGAKVLADPLVGCDRGTELARLVALVGSSRPAVLDAEVAASEAALDTDALAASPACADAPALVLAVTALHAARGDRAAAESVLSRAIAATEARRDTPGNRDIAALDLALYRQRLATLPASLNAATIPAGAIR